MLSRTCWPNQHCDASRSRALVQAMILFSGGSAAGGSKIRIGSVTPSAFPQGGKAEVRGLGMRLNQVAVGCVRAETSYPAFIVPCFRVISGP